MGAADRPTSLGRSTAVPAVGGARGRAVCGQQLPVSTPSVGMSMFSISVVCVSTYWSRFIRSLTRWPGARRGAWRRCAAAAERVARSGSGSRCRTLGPHVLHQRGVREHLLGHVRQVLQFCWPWHPPRCVASTRPQQRKQLPRSRSRNRRRRARSTPPPSQPRTPPGLPESAGTHMLGLQLGDHRCLRRPPPTPDNCSGCSASHPARRDCCSNCWSR